MSHDAFLKAIIDNPDDESLRLIYADYLDEQGDLRADFLRVQCALASLAYDDPRRKALDARERKLLGPVVAQLLGARLHQFLEEPATFTRTMCRFGGLAQSRKPCRCCWTWAAANAAARRRCG
jgi:uncharacterized protein (TIGR02996 family)